MPRHSRLAGVAVALLTLTALAGCTREDDRGDAVVPPPAESLWVSAAADQARLLAGTAAAWGIVDPPEVAVVREVSAAEAVEVQAECMTGQGFPPDEGGMYSAPDDQTGALSLALYRCMAMYPLQHGPTEGKYAQPMSTTQMGILYDYYVKDLTPCLMAHGFTVEPAPTLEEFVATIGTVDEYYPYASFITTLNWTATHEIQDACPGHPPVDELHPE